MGYELSYGGVSLPLSVPELEAHLARLLPPQDFTGLNQWQFNGFNLQQLPTPNLPTFPDVEPGLLWWPTGASRCAVGYFVVNGTKLSEIRTAIGNVNTAQPLVLSDSRDGFSITPSMWMLPPRPLNQVYGGTDARDGWLLTFVDRRFYDFWKRGVIAQPTSWNDLYDQLGDILGTVIFPDTISSAYGLPSSKWVQEYQPTTTMLDAAAAQVGQVVVYGLDGSIRTVNATTAKVDSDSQIENVVAQVGGLVLESDIARYVPASVNVLFGVSTDTSTAHVVNETLAALAITEYGSQTGVPNTEGTTFADLLYTGTNTSTVNTYAIQAATDWYGWRLPNLDVSIPGIYPWVPTGWEDSIEWRYQRREGAPHADTRIRRGQWDNLPSGTWWAGIVPIPPNWVPSGGSGSGSGSGGAGCIEPISVTCSNGTRTLTIKDIKVGVVNNQLVLEECSQNDTALGPCSPVTPGGTTLPVLTLACPIYAKCVDITTDYIVGDFDVWTIYADATGGSIQVQLPPSQPAMRYRVQKTDDTANTVTVVPDGSETINGAANYVLDMQWQTVTVEAMCAGGWGAELPSSGGSGTVESVTLTTAQGLLVNGVATDTITTTGTFALTLPFTVSGSGSVANSGTSSLSGFTGSGSSSGSNSGDQNLFLTVAVSGQSDIVADSTTDTLTFAAGSGVTLTTNASTDTLTISATGTGGTVTSITVTTANGLLVSTGTTQTITTSGTFALTLPFTVSGSGSLANSGTSSLTSFTGSGSSSGSNTGDQTSTLTGAVTGSGTNSIATTIATPGTLTVSSTNSTATAHTHAITSSSAPGAAASILATDASGHIGSTGTRIVKGWFIDLTVTNAIAGSITGNAATATALATGRTISITGDLTYTSPSFDGTGNVTAAGTLATVNSNVGTFGSATKSVTATVNGKGLVTAISEATITPAVGSITGLGTGVATFLATPSSANLAAAVTDETGSGALVFGASPTLTTPALGTPSALVLTNATGLSIAGIAVGVMRGYLAGCGTVRASTTTITVNAGTGRDSTDLFSLYLSAATTKTLQSSGSWAAGTGQNGLDTGARANSTSYHVYLIATATGGSVDVIFSTSASSPSLPATYTLYRIIGSIRTDGSGNIINYIQDGDDFQWLVPFADVAATNPGTSAVTRTLTLPTGRRFKANLTIGFSAVIATDNPGAVFISDLSITDSTASATGAFTQQQNNSGIVVNQNGSTMSVYTNTSAQVRSRVQTSSTNTLLEITTLGWTDTRGRNA